MANVENGKPILIGILVDVSGSMLNAIGTSGSRAVNRLQAFGEALEETVKKAAASIREPTPGGEPANVRLFVYGFGFGGLASVIFGSGGSGVRDLLASRGGEGTIDVLRLADDWSAQWQKVRDMASDMFGTTPMKEAFAIAKRRLSVETTRRSGESVLFVLSDGDPTDGNATDILPIVEGIKAAGTTVVSCFVTDADITDMKCLYGRFQRNWPPAARLMFDCASELSRDSRFSTYLREHGWKIERDAKLFAQVNQSEMLSEFLNVILGPLSGGPSENTDTSGQAASQEIQPRSPHAVRTRDRAASAPDSKARLLFIHGLGGHPTKTWGQLPEFLLADSEFARRYEVGFYAFPTSLIRLPFSNRAPKVQELAAGLRTQIEHDDLERINLVCHSLGGLIARRYLIEEVRASRPLRIERLALCAVPNNGAGLASVGQMVSWRHGQMAQLCRDADLIEFLNEDWFHFDVQNKVQIRFISGTQDQVVDRFSVAGYWGNPNVDTIVGKGHIDLVKPDNPNDLLVKVLRRFLLD